MCCCEDEASHMKRPFFPSTSRNTVISILHFSERKMDRWLGTKDSNITGAPSLFEGGAKVRSLDSYVNNSRNALSRKVFGAVGLATLFNLWVLRAERYPVAYPNDSGMHLQMSVFASSLFGMGQAPLGHWYPFLSLGSPFFIDYQSSSAIFIGLLGHFVGVAQTYAWSLYLLLALWPLCVYFSARLLGLTKSVAAIAGFLSPLIISAHGHGFEYKSYLWIGNGLWSQQWAMWTLPLAWGFSWRYINSRRNYFWAVLFISLTVVFHFLTAYMALLGVALWVIVAPRQWRVRTTRAGLLAIAVVGSTAWITVPLLLQGKWLAVNAFQIGTTINNSYGGGQAFSWLVHGGIYDNQRWPEITALVAIGLLVTIVKARREIRARALLAVWIASFIFFSGRPTFAWLLDLIPGNQGILFQRYIAELQLSGLFLAGVGLVALVRGVVAFVYGGLGLSSSSFRMRSSLYVGLCLVILVAGSWSAVSEMNHYAHRSAQWISYQRRADATNGTEMSALISTAVHDGGGRIYAGMPSNWGANFTIGAVPVYIYLEQAEIALGRSGIDAVGFTLRTSGTMTNPECYFDQFNPGDYTAFGIRYLLLPRNKHPFVAATLVRQSGPYALWRVANFGLIHVIQTSGVIHANATNIGARNWNFLDSASLRRGIYPLLSYDGAATPAPTLTASSSLPANDGGIVLRQRDLLLNGRATATVRLTQTSVVLLSAAYEPGWTVTVDGVPQHVAVIAPALVGVRVTPGTHRIVFQWHEFQYYDLLYLLALITLAGGGFMSWRHRHDN